MKWVIVNKETGEFAHSVTFVGSHKHMVWTLDIDMARLFNDDDIVAIREELSLDPEDIRAVGLFLLERDGTPSFLKQPFTICIDDPVQRQKLIEVFEHTGYGFSISTSSPSTTVRMSVDGSKKEE